MYHSGFTTFHGANLALIVILKKNSLGGGTKLYSSTEAHECEARNGDHLPYVISSNLSIFFSGEKIFNNCLSFDRKTELSKPETSNQYHER